MKTKNFEINHPTNNLLDATGDLSVHQLGAYHTIVTVFRIISTGKPNYLAEKLVLRKPEPNLIFPTRNLNKISVKCGLTAADLPLPWGTYMEPTNTGSQKRN